MQYRNFPCAPEAKISILGFGSMRMPYLNDDSGQIDEPEAIKMIRYAIDNGVTYVDTAYPYHKGNSELLVAKALKDGYREKVYLATKHPVWLVEEYADFDKYLDEQLAKLETDCIDFYLLHALNKDRWPKLKELGAIKFLEDARAKGKIKYIGFSFHDELPLFKQIVDDYNWDFTQIQLNFMDTEYQAGLEGMKYAADHGLGIIVMEPLRGGSLTKNVPDDVLAVWDKAEIKRTPAEWCLRWAANLPETVTILSGMSLMEQVVENVKVPDDCLPNTLTEKELAIIEEVKEIYTTRTTVNCTGCKYCMPCPVGINIPGILQSYNTASVYNIKEAAAKRYQTNMIDKGIDATICIECGACVSACPQNIDVPNKLKEAHAYFTQK